MKELYSWVRWFRELAEKISEGDKAYLIEKAREVEWGKTPTLLRYGDEAINPFSFFYFLASKNTSKQLKPVFHSVSSVFEIEPLLYMDVDERFVFPVPNFNILFYDETNSNMDLLWRLFRQAAVKDEPKIDPDEFKKVLDIKGVGIAKLTQTLFLTNPEYFLPMDNVTKDLWKVLDLPTLSEIENDGYETYRSFLEKLKEAFPECQPYEINMFLYLQNSGKIKVNDNFYQISTQVYGDKKGDHWDDFKYNNWVYTGGPGGKSWGEPGKYPLEEPAPGDIILVRTGITKGKAIGIVQKNDYVESGINKDSRIHVLWINKEQTDLSRKTEQVGFAKTKSDSKTYLAFENTDAYKPSFELIEKMKGNSIGNEPETDTMKYLQPLNQILRSRDPIQDTGEDLFLRESEIERLIALLRRKKNLVLQGPPGTGKTYLARGLARLLVGEKSENRIETVQFHQSYGYEDFVQGYRPTGDGGFELKDGPFLRFCERAQPSPDCPFVLVIDEINRGNLSRIFGELLMLIEADKRKPEWAVQMAYSDEDTTPFHIPPNLYLIGTMNTADRSLALVDYALRRRFVFHTVEPAFGNERFARHLEERGVPEELQERIRNRLGTLNKTIREDQKLGGGFQIGHSYFCDPPGELRDAKDSRGWEKWYEDVIRYEIEPLLAEYWFDDSEKAKTAVEKLLAPSADNAP